MKKHLNGLEDNCCALILVVMLLLTFVNVVARYVFLASMPFVEELTRLGLMILSLVGASVAAKRGAHLGLSIVTDLLSPGAQKVIALLSDLLAIFFGAILTYYGYAMVRNEYVNGLKTPGMQWPEWIFGMWVIVGGAILVIRFAQMFVQKLMNKGGENV